MKSAKFLTNALVFFAVIGIIILLSSINIKLLSKLNWFQSNIKLLDTFYIISAGIAFAIGSISIVIFYNPDKKQKLKYIAATFLKVTFVSLDGFHIYIYNNIHIQDLATWLSPVYAVQTALILFFLGDVVDNIIKDKKSNIQENKSMFSQSDTELKKYKTYFIKSELGRIRKKKPENYTEEEKAFLQTHGN